MAQGDVHELSQSILSRFIDTRTHSTAIAAPLSEEDCCVQSMPDASPIKWHLAHTTWFFETFILEKLDPDFTPFDPVFRVLFNSYYNGVGAKHPRAQRGLLTRPTLAEVMRYRQHLDHVIESLWNQLRATGKLAAITDLLELGIQHEQQHQELMLTDIKHLFAQNPIGPRYLSQKTGPSAVNTQTSTFICFEAGLSEIGHTGQGFYFDNELPRHRVFLEAYALSSALVTNREYLGFVQDGGYANPTFWLSEAWDWIRQNSIQNPWYWRKGENGAWYEFTLHGSQQLELDAPVVHLSYFEADAYARWAGARLPTEAEWENAANSVFIQHTGSSSLHPHSTSQQAFGDMFGQVWQWTSSSYSPYPGYAPAPGAIGEYNGKFMVNQYVLRGASCVTPVGHSRASYRNFFPATARWQFSGLRLARSE